VGTVVGGADGVMIDRVAVVEGDRVVGVETVVAGVGCVMTGAGVVVREDGRSGGTAEVVGRDDLIRGTGSGPRWRRRRG